jgi:hypothetical protein
MPVERTRMAPPGCRLGAISPAERAALRAQSGLGGKYDALLNRESAFEVLAARAAQASASPAPASTNAPAGRGTTTPPATKSGSAVSDFLWGTGRRQGAVEAMAKSAARTVGNQLGRQLLRGLLGGLIGGRR